MLSSKLGVGIMRWPSNPDMKTFQEFITFSMSNGVNYFEACAFYNSGNCESILQKLLVSYPRDSYVLCDKMPVHGFLNKMSPKDIFEKQLKIFNTNYFDYYLIQCVDRNTFEILRDKKVVEYFSNERKAGRIRKLGFSFHDNEVWLLKYLELLDWDCVQIQLNYLDWYTNNHAKLAAILHEKNIPIFVMGALKGGNLTYNLPIKALKMLNNADSERTIASWGMQFASQIQGVHMVLTGATNLAELKDNVETVLLKKYGELDLSVLSDVSNLISRENFIPCNYCGYCETQCPIGKPISRVFRLYNSLLRSYNDSEKAEYLNVQNDMRIGFNSCTGCGKCTRICPQKINVKNTLFEIGMMYR